MSSLPPARWVLLTLLEALIQHCEGAVASEEPVPGTRVLLLGEGCHVPAMRDEKGPFGHCPEDLASSEYPILCAAPRVEAPCGMQLYIASVCCLSH